jgi:hypothetical protein
MSMYLTILRGSSADQATPLVATSDMRIIEGVLREISNLVALEDGGDERGKLHPLKHQTQRDAVGRGGHTR